jgi:DNA polymerase III subunit epsilon
MRARRKSGKSDIDALFSIFAILGTIIFALFSLFKYLYDLLKRKGKTEYSQSVEFYTSPYITKSEVIRESTPSPINIYRPPTRKHAKPEIDKFLNVKRKTKIIVFDLETNGLKGSDSVLSCSAIKLEIDPSTCEVNELEHFSRYYFPVERYNPRAIAVNGLTKEAIADCRGDCDYPPHFIHDDGFIKFCEGVNRYVAHNISFDSRFVPHISRKKRFCTMMENMDIVAVQYLEYKNQWKWPTLSETATYYGVTYEGDELHKSINDTRITASIFKKMLEVATGEK